MKKTCVMIVLLLSTLTRAAAPRGWTCYAAGGNVYKAAVGGKPQTVASGVGAVHACWSRDGSLVFFSTKSGDIYAVSHTGKDRTKIGSADNKSYRAIAPFRPEPRSVLCVKGRTFYKINAATGSGLVKIADADCAVDGEIAISSDGKRLVWRSSGISSKLRKMTVGGKSSGYASNCSAGLSPNGQYLLENVSGHTSLRIYNWGGGNNPVSAGVIGHWDNQSFAVNSDTWICALDDDPTLNDNKGTGVGIVSRGNEKHMVTSWSGATTMYPSFFAGALPAASTPPDTGSTPPDTGTSSPVQEAQFYEKNGICVIEAESNGAPGKWALHTGTGTHGFVKGFTGTGCLQFTGNQESSGPVSDPIDYTIRISKAGKYNLRMRALEAPLETGEGDKANDCYIKMAGQDGTGQGQSGCEGKFTKFVLLGGSRQWLWDVKIECGHHKFFVATYYLDAGIHTLSIAGRSKNFFIDRMVLTASGSGYTDLSLTECRSPDCAGGTADPAAPTKILEPASGSTLTMGSTVTLKGEGDNLRWSYDANSDGKAEIAVGSGETVKFTVPTGIKPPREITLILKGDGGTVRRTYSLADGATSLVSRAPLRRYRSEEAVRIYSINGALINSACPRNGGHTIQLIRRENGRVRIGIGRHNETLD